MNFKYLIALIGVLLLGAGLALAVQGATATQVSQNRWNSMPAAGNIVTQGGNITAANISGTMLTSRWAAFFGNVSGSVVLRDNTATVYSWTWNATSGGQVCLSTATAYTFATAAAASVANAQAIDAAGTFNLGSVADNATNTFTTASCTLNFASIPAISNTANVTTTGGFNTCLLQDGATAAKTDFAFCTAINSTGQSYLAQPANYQVMVPITPGGGTQAYYFYMDLN